MRVQMQASVERLARNFDANTKLGHGLLVRLLLLLLLLLSAEHR